MRVVVAAAVAAAVGCAHVVTGNETRIVGGTVVTDANKYPFLATLRTRTNQACVAVGAVVLVASCML
jgi:hypothetical protein